MMLEIWKKYRNWAILTFVFVWMLVFDSNNLIDLVQLRGEISELNEKKEFYNSEIEKLKKEEKELFTNKRNLEKFAREKYLMKKDNEDIFIIREED